MTMTDDLAHFAMVESAKVLEERLTSKLQHLLGPEGKGSGYSLVVVGHSLGAGIAALLGMIFRRGHFPQVRCVCVEPPGGLWSPNLAKESEMFILSMVTADDWVPRISIRSVHSLRDNIILELEHCSATKFHVFTRLWWFFIVRALCVKGKGKRWYEVVLDPEYQNEDTSSEATDLVCSWKEEMDWLRTNGGLKKNKTMIPPGRIIFLQPQREEDTCCCYTMQLDHTASWIPPEALKKLILHPRAMEHHSPHIFQPALEAAIEAFYHPPSSRR